MIMFGKYNILEKNKYYLDTLNQLLFWVHYSSEDCIFTINLVEDTLLEGEYWVSRTVYIDTQI
jgi:hypothetical protein